ncbi:MAG: glycosyltransferase [Desulfobacterales bacterium]
MNAAGQNPKPRKADAPAATVSVVVPVKASHASIRPLCLSLIGQTVKPSEILLVGDAKDPTWGPIADLIDTGRVKVIEVERPPDHLGRDTNLKRRAGCASATGRIIAVTDADMILPPDWIRTGLELLDRNPVDSVAGTILSAPRNRTFSEHLLNLYTDYSILAKTPRFSATHVVGKANFGKGKKLPISANWFFTREAYNRSGGFDPAFTLSYEDYSLAWRMVSAGCTILCTRLLWGYHHHRQDIRSLVKEYVKSGRGCAMFIFRYPKSPMSRRRVLQVAAAVLAFGFIASGMAWMPWKTAAVLGIAYAAAGALNAHRAGRFGFLFPGISLILGSAFTFGVLNGLWLGGTVNPKDRYLTDLRAGR